MCPVFVSIGCPVVQEIQSTSNAPMKTSNMRDAPAVPGKVACARGCLLRPLPAAARRAHSQENMRSDIFSPDRRKTD
ncbi:hypothetical protein pqer_cds_6 [Pandoravirus quercus]|uniref:Uncharacterized protein n=1 Tax=Pandoravirus quercus TaxID=2107709 RepID=A0A2U7U7M4_9VIRU|nr:hypothetical protein pqer_cds_6 [Pandoravirus quercus]AVK74428.1 hypothetical protein pqer_cds_6 [Pandoravirus quercus]